MDTTSTKPTVTPTPSASNAAIEQEDDSPAMMVGIYGGGVLKDKSSLTDIRNSGFTTLICWTLHISDNGDLIYNDGDPIVKDGKYNGLESWPSDLIDAFKSPTTLTRLVFSVGSWGSHDFRNIRLLMAKFGDSQDNPLYANFKALKSTIPHIQTIDFDNEDDFDQDSLVSFSKLLYGLGFNVSFCPYNNLYFWEGALRKLHSFNPNIVTGYNLQCYAGGAGNASYFGVGEWIKSVHRATGLDMMKAAAFVRPGFFCKHQHQHETKGRLPIQVMSELLEWKPHNLKGAWLWIYDDVLKNKGTVQNVDTSTDAYATSILSGLI